MKELSQTKLKKEIYKNILLNYPKAGKLFAEEWSKKLSKELKKVLKGFEQTVDEKHPIFHLEYPLVSFSKIKCYYRIDKIREYIEQGNFPIIYLPIERFISNQDIKNNSYSKKENSRHIQFEFHYDSEYETENIEPIYVMNCFSSGETVIDGNHRVSFCKKKQIKNIPCILLQEKEILSEKFYADKLGFLLAQFSKKLS
ncbi:TPA: hypothetical protein ACF0SI_002676 [Enterococcus hirae]